jgi:hypothetical protein
LLLPRRGSLSSTPLLEPTRTVLVLVEASEILRASASDGVGESIETLARGVESFSDPDERVLYTNEVLGVPFEHLH